MGRSFHECIVAAAVFLLSALVAGCGSGGGEPAALVPAGSDAVQAQVTKEGGALELTTTGGARLKLTVPPGALHLPATIVLREAAPLSGALATFTIEPAGTRLHLPATLEASFPVEPDPGVSLGAWFGTPDSRTSMPGTYDARTRTYTFQSWFLGYAAIPAPDASAADPKGIEREKLVRSVKDLADPRAAPSGSDFINVGLLSCEIELTSLGERIERAKLLPLSGELASQLISQFKATRDRCQASSIDDEVARTVAVTTQLQALACEKYNAASTTARVLAGATSADEMNAQLKPIIAAAALAMHTGADCASADDLASVLEPEFSDFLDNYIDRVNAPGFLTDDAQIWRQAWAEQVKAYDIAATAEMLNMESADRQVWTEVLAPILRQLRKIAYAACRDEEFREERFLVDINTGGWLFGHPVVSDPELPPWADFSADDLLRDIQLCASRLTIRTYPPVTEGVEVHEEKTLGGGNAPGTHSATAQMRLVPDGAIHLSGPIHDFTCGNPTGSARPENATVTIMADDHVLGTVSLQGASLQTVPFVASFSTILDTLASPSSQQGAPSRFRLRVLRNGSGCGGTHGPDNFELFSIDFGSEMPQILVSVSGTNMLRPGESSQFVATVENASDPSVVWSTDGGTITQNGYYTAPAVPGRYVVTATSVQDPQRSGSRIVTVPGDEIALTLLPARQIGTTLTSAYSKLETYLLERGELACFEYLRLSAPLSPSAGGSDTFGPHADCDAVISATIFRSEPGWGEARVDLWVSERDFPATGGTSQGKADLYFQMQTTPRRVLKIVLDGSNVMPRHNDGSQLKSGELSVSIGPTFESAAPVGFFRSVDGTLYASVGTGDSGMLAVSVHLGMDSTTYGRSGTYSFVFSIVPQ